MLIIYIDGNEFKWETSDYTSYELTNKYFIVKKDEQWIGCYYIANANQFWFEVREDL